jgi:NADPH:quinone reductase-like Zn-dependent oxidoreductase
VSQEAVVGLSRTWSYEKDSTSLRRAHRLDCALTGPVPIRAGHTVLVMGSGGVSVFALHLARAVGATVIATASSARKADRLKDLGAAEVANYADDPN